MSELGEILKERTSEIIEYLDFMDHLERNARVGHNHFSGIIRPSPTQMHVLLSNLYMQLYNLVEGIVSKCIEYLITELIKTPSPSPRRLSRQIRREWIKWKAKTDTILGSSKRFDIINDLCDYIINDIPIGSFGINISTEGNLCDQKIKSLFHRIGCEYNVPNDVYRKIKHPISDGDGVLAFLVKRRNALSHGNITFGECGKDKTTSDLRDIAIRVFEYLACIVDNFDAYMESKLYLDENIKRNRT